MTRPFSSFHINSIAWERLKSHIYCRISLENSGVRLYEEVWGHELTCTKGDGTTVSRRWKNIYITVEPIKIKKLTCLLSPFPRVFSPFPEFSNGQQNSLEKTHLQRLEDTCHGCGRGTWTNIKRTLHLNNTFQKIFTESENAMSLLFKN